jgi:tetratricopeptide (TPR) repeat protein
MARWIGVALVLASVGLGLPRASAQQQVASSLARYGRMSAGDAQGLARRVHERLVANARQRGDRYDPVRQALGMALFGGPGRTRAEYDQRLRQVLARLADGLSQENLAVLFAPGDGAAMRCAELFEVPMAACDALIAAASRQRADLPYLASDDGATLRSELAATGVPGPQAVQIVRALSETLASVPRSLDATPRGQGLTRLMAACPGGLDTREHQVRAWHLGVTSDLARCVGRVVGREGRTAPQRLQELTGMPSDVAVSFLRWAHGQPVAAAPAARPPSRDQLMAQASRHYRARRFAEAAQAYEQVLLQDPGFGPAHQGLAVSRLQAGDARGAADAYRAAARLEPRSAGLQVGLARALTRLGDGDGAIAAYRLALSLEPRHAEAARELAALQPAPAGPNEGQLRQQARAHFQARRFAQAEGAYRQLAALVPDDAGAHAGLGASLLALGRAGDAVAAYRRATELDGRNGSFFAALGATLEQAGDASGARAAYERALALDPRQGTARQGLARLPAPAPEPTPAPTGAAPALASALPRPTEPAPPPPPEPALPETPSRDDIVRTMLAFEQRLEACAPTVDATVTFRLRISGTDGRVESAETLGVLANTDEGRCMEQHLGTARFPRFSRGVLEVSYPFQLRGPQADQPEDEAPPPVE